LKRSKYENFEFGKEKIMKIPKIQNFTQNSKFFSKIKILLKNPNFSQKSKILLKTPNFAQKSKFC